MTSKEAVAMLRNDCKECEYEIEEMCQGYEMAIKSLDMLDKVLDRLGEVIGVLSVCATSVVTDEKNKAYYTFREKDVHDTIEKLGGLRDEVERICN